MKHTTCSATALSLLLLPAGSLIAGQSQGTMGVSVQVLLSHQPQLAQAVPLPGPGHVMLENANGRHYAYDGSVDAARAYYLTQMRDRGYALKDERADEGHECAMRWQRADEIVEIDMRAALGVEITRISLRVMKDARPHAPG